MAEDTSWFEDEEWQKGERKADEDLKKGRYKDFDTIEELIEHLHHERARKKDEEREADKDFEHGNFNIVNTEDELSALFDAKEKEIEKEEE